MIAPLLWPCRVPVGVAFACSVGRDACWGNVCVRSWAWQGPLKHLRRLEGLTQTAALNAQKKPLLRPRGALEPLLWLCGVFSVREWRVLGLLGYLFPAELGGPLEGLERLRPGKR